MQDAGSIYALLRFDKKYIDNDTAIKIFEESLKMELKDEKFLNNNNNNNFKDIDELRKHIYDTKLKKRVEDGRRKLQEENEDDESDEEDSEEDEEAIECNCCVEMMPDVYCEECKMLLCETCIDDKKAVKHDSKHKVTPLDEIDDLTALAEKLKKLSI